MYRAWYIQTLSVICNGELDFEFTILSYIVQAEFDETDPLVQLHLYLDDLV